MSFSRHTSRIYIDIDDINGAINVLTRRIAEPPQESTPYYMGALMTLAFMRNHEDIRDQSVFMQLFDCELIEHNVQPITEGE